MAFRTNGGCMTDLLTKEERGGAFLSVVHEGGGDWLYSDAVPYVGGGVS